MPAGSLLALLDDITTVLDDVAALTKVAAKKTAGVLGDDLALNAQQVTGFEASREIPVVLAVARGSAINKLILVPLALAISVLAPWAVVPLLMIGGAYLCFEGFEKVVHSLQHRKTAEADPPSAKAHAEPRKAGTDASAHADVPAPDAGAELERTRIRGAVRTDFILSAEIIVISLGTVAGEPLMKQLGVLVAISVLMTVGVYGLVAGIVKLDDAGLHLSRRASGRARAMGRFILRAAPVLMRTLSILGTAAMFLVGGGILVHGLPPVEHAVASWTEATPAALGWLISPAAGSAVGLLAGGLILALVTALRPRRTS